MISERMYKTRFKAWGLRKYTLEPSIKALAQTIERRKRVGKATRILKNDRVFPQARILSHLKKKGITLEDVLKDLELSAPTPDGYRCLTPSPDEIDTTSTDNAIMIEAHRPQANGSQSGSDVNTGSRSDCEESNVRGSPNLTPESSTGGDMVPFQSVSCYFGAGTRSSTASATSFSMASPDGLPELGTLAPDRDENCDLSVLMDEIAEEVFQSFTPGSSDSAEMLRINFHHSLGLSVDADQLTSPSLTAASEPRLNNVGQAPCTLPMLRSEEAQPEKFIAYCFLACILFGKGCTEIAQSSAQHATWLYQAMIVDRHTEVLACLYVVLGVLITHGHNAFAGWILQQARLAALLYLHQEHPAITTISFMIVQSTGDPNQIRASEIGIEKLRQVYQELQYSCHVPGTYALNAGYNLAWRLALEAKTDREAAMEALMLLTSLRVESEQTFGPAHMQTIAILNTTARVVFHLGSPLKGIEIAAIFMQRIQQAGFHEHHPYHLEAKRRYAMFFEAVGSKESKEIAERLLEEVALGKSVALGPDHKFSKDSIEEVERFLVGRTRVKDRKRFHERLAQCALQGRASSDLETY